MRYPVEAFAEDLTFKTLKEAKNDWAIAALQYFQRLSRRRRIVSTHRKQGSWRNASLILRNCYYLAEMERYLMPDPEGITKRTNERLLSSLPPFASTAFDYYRKVFLGLRENITTEDYKKTSEEYLSKFIALAEGRSD